MQSLPFLAVIFIKPIPHRPRMQTVNAPVCLIVYLPDVNLHLYWQPQAIVQRTESTVKFYTPDAKVIYNTMILLLYFQTARYISCSGIVQME